MRDYRKISFWNKFWIHFFKIFGGDPIEASLGKPSKDSKQDGWAYMRIRGKKGSKTLIISGDPIQENEKQ